MAAGDPQGTAGAGGSFETGDGVEIAYWRWPVGLETTPVVLHHGFTGDTHRDWVDTGVVAALAGAGRTVVALDARGHGRSGKPHRPDAYGEDRMARDVSGLATELGLTRFDLIGFSMGAVVAVLVATRERRMRRLVTLGVGASVVENGGVDTESPTMDALAHALLSEEGDPSIDAASQTFLDGLVGRDVDRTALAMHARSVHRTPIALHRITAPALVVAGDADPYAKRPEVLAAAIPRAKCLVVTGDHGTCVTNPQFARAAIDFLDRSA